MFTPSRCLGLVVLLAPVVACAGPGDNGRSAQKQTAVPAVDPQRVADQLAWESALAENTDQGYRTFLELHPDSTQAGQVEGHIEELAWGQAQASDSIATYEQFMAAYPNSDQNGAIRLRLIDLALAPVVRSAKSGDVAGVQAFLASDDSGDGNLKARAFMMGVWGALHTTPGFSFVDGQIDTSQSRTAGPPRAKYIAIVKLLLDAGADPNLYEFEEFGSVNVGEYLNALELQRLADAVTPGEVVSTTYTIGGTPNTNLVPTGEGMTAADVAKIEGANDILALLAELP